MTIQAQLDVSPENRDLNWLQTSLEYAIELEHSTIPPYLCAWWSVKDQTNAVAQLIHGIVLEEMMHMSLSCNMLTTIGGTPAIDTPDFIPKYPGPLPHGVRPTLKSVGLVGLSLDVVENVFTQIEYPESGPVGSVPRRDLSHHRSVLRRDPRGVPEATSR